MRRHRLAVVNAVVLACFFALGSTAPVQAELVYSLRFDQTEYQVAPGSMFDVQLIFREQATGGDVNHLTDTIGLTAADLKVGWTNGGSKVTAEDDTSYGPDFFPISKTLAAADVAMQQLAFSPGVLGTDLGGGIREVGVGTLTFTAANTVGDVTIVRYADYDPDLSNLVIGFDDGLGNDTTFDVDVFGVTYGTAIVTSVPEPGTLVLMSLAATCALSGYGVRRLRKQNDPSLPVRRNCTDINAAN